MNRILLSLIMGMLAAVMISGSAQATEVSVTAKGNLSLGEYVLNTTTNLTAVTLEMPFNVTSFNASSTTANITIKLGTSMHILYNLSVDNWGVTEHYLNSSLPQVNGTWVISGTNLTTNLTGNDILVTLSSNDTVDNINITIIGENVSLDPTNVPIAVADVITSPSVQIAFYAIDSFYGVGDTINVTNLATTNVFNLTNVNLTIAYPGNKLSEDVTTYIIASLNASFSNTSAVMKYLKQGPYVITAPTAPVTDTTYSANYTIYAPEALTAIVGWTLTPESYPAVFLRFNYTGMVVEVNGIPVTWTKTGSITLTAISLVAEDNMIKFIWTPIVVPVCVPENGTCTVTADCCTGLECIEGTCQTPPVPFYLTWWFWVAVIIVAVIGIAAVTWKR